METDSSEFICELTYRAISSADFNIKTKAIWELQTQVLSWLSTSTCGAIVYGRARIGKTRALSSVAVGIQDKYGSEFPVVIWDITDHAVTEKNFYTSLLMAMGFQNIPRAHTALALKERVLNELYLAAVKTPFKRVVIMLDEAWKLDEKDFSWLMDLYNNLNHKDIQLICFLFGTRELKDFKTEFKDQGKDQIVGRFMINEFQFCGIQDIKELAVCLMALDKKTIRTNDGDSTILVSDYFFPDREGRTFLDLVNDYWNAFLYIQGEYCIKSTDIPMKYLIDSFILMLKNYGKFSPCKVAFPTSEELIKCVRESGYGESDDEYDSAKQQSPKSKLHRRY